MGWNVSWRWDIGCSSCGRGLDCVLDGGLSYWLWLDVLRARDCGFWVLSQPCSLVGCVLVGGDLHQVIHFVYLLCLWKLAPGGLTIWRSVFFQFVRREKWDRFLSCTAWPIKPLAISWVEPVKSKMMACTAGDRLKHLPKGTEVRCEPRTIYRAVEPRTIIMCDELSPLPKRTDTWHRIACTEAFIPALDLLHYEPTFNTVKNYRWHYLSG